LSLGHGEERENTPLFRRVLLPAERVAEELKRVPDGVLVRMPLAEFDALTERATRAASRTIPPRLLEAHYHATLKDDALIGEGQWKLIHKGPSPRLLNLEPFNLALRQARFENGDALIAAFDGKIPSLLVETVGEQTLSLDWSARGEAGPQGLQFHLEAPSCPVAVLELDVPAGRGVTVLNDGAILSGPHEAETNELRRWKIVCGGRRSLDFRILPTDRSTAGAEQTPPLVRWKTTQKLHPEGLDAAFELTLEGLTRGVRELVCECDAELRLREVTGPSVEGCSFQAGRDDKPARLTIRLREPVRGGTWQIVCLAPLRRSPSSDAAKPIAWRSPGMRLVNGVPRGETLTLWLHPEVRVESWDTGSFRLSSSDTDRATGMQVLTLRGGGLGPPRRPQARLQVHGVAFRAPQLAWWRCDAAGMALTVQIAWDVSQGQLFQLPVLLPRDWNVEKVEMTPTALLRDWRVRSVEGKATLFVDLSGPLGVRAARARLPLLTVQLRPAWSGPVTRGPLPFPEAVPLGARFHEGALALDCDEQLFHLNVKTKAERSEADSEGPWGSQLPEYYYRYSSDPLQGELQVRSRPPRLRAKCKSEVFVVSGLAIVETRIQLEAEVGNPSTIDVQLSASDAKPWHWRAESSARDDDAAVNDVRHAERLRGGETSAAVQALAARHPLQTAILLAAQPTGERWRLTLARPLHARETLLLHARRQLQPHDNRWDVPLPIVLGVDRMEGEARLYLAGADLMQVQTHGMREAVAVAEKGATPWRTFRYGANEVGLRLSGQALASDRSAVAVIERARLVTAVGADGVLRHHFSFQVANWSKHTLPLILPAGARPLAAAIDGRWLPRLLPSTSDDGDSASQGEALELALPVPGRADAAAGDNVHGFEVLYTRSVAASMPWQALDAPAPRLPIAPLAFRRVWHLPANLTPLHAGRYQSLSIPSGGVELPALPHHVADLFRLPGSWARLDPLMDDRQAGAREALDRAVQELRVHRAERTMPLREVVDEIAFNHLKDRYYLIIDALALREAGVGPETSLTISRPSSDEAPPPWTECGLIAVPGRSTILLTTLSGRGAVLREPLGDAVEHLLAAAVAHGRDASGRFRSALNWLHPDRVSAASAAEASLLNFDDHDAGGNDWEPLAGATEETLIVVRRDAVTAAGLALTLFLGLFFWLLRGRSVRRRVTLLLLALALFGVGVLWLPSALRDLAWWPLLAGCGGAVLWYVRASIRSARTTRSPSRKSKRPVAAALTGLAALTLLGWNSRAAAPTTPTVYLLPGPADAPGKQTVLVPADLLARLKTLARPAPLAPAGPSAVLLDASYEGQMKEGQAEFTAVFSAHCLSDDSTALTLGLAGVQLFGDVLLDGARAAPLALPVPQIGYSLPVRGRGRHKIELRFRVPVVGTPEDRNVLFTVPPLVRSRLSWRVPPGAEHTRNLVKFGAQWTLRDGGERLEADLGALPRPVHLHWYQPTRPTRVFYRAAYRWDLGLEDNHLTAWLRYRVPEGGVQSLEIVLPGELEVGSATAQRILSASPPSWLARFQLRDWYVSTANGKRTLHLTLPYPIGGEFMVTLELLPRRPLTSLAELPLPWPRQAAADGAHFLAYRTQPGLNAYLAQSLYLSRIGESEFAPDWPSVPPLEANLPGAAYKITVERSPEQARLRLHLEHRPPLFEAAVDVTVQAAAQRANIQIVADVKAPNKDLAAIVWDLRSPCTITAVSGDDVRSWTQNDRQVLVWLNRTTATTRIQLSGWLPLDRTRVPAHLHLLGPRLRQAGKQHTRLRLVTVGDVGLASVRTNNLHPPAPLRRSAERERAFETEAAFYELHCEVQAAANATARVLTLAEVADGELRFTTSVNYQIHHGELRHVQLRLRNWEPEKVEVRAERVALWSGPRRSIGERSWHLPLQAGVTGDYQVTLHYSMPLDDAAVGLPMPQVLVQGVEQPEYLLAVSGGELTGQARGALGVVNISSKTLKRFWPGAAARLERRGGQVWRIIGAEWQVRLLPHARASEPAPVRVYLLEQTAAVRDGRRWLHEARCWLRHEAHTDLHIDFPAPVRVLAAAIDGVEVTPLQPDSARVWLTLPGRPGVRCIRLRWQYDSTEPLDRPNLASPRVADAVKGPTLWTVLLPAGWEAAQSTPNARLGSGSARAAALALYRAEAQLRIRQDLSKQKQDTVVSAALALAQQRFALSCLEAQHALAVGGNRGGVVGPEGQSLAEWLEKLQADNRSIRAGSVSDAGDVSVADASGSFNPPLVGTPISWQARADGQAPILQLTSRASQQTRQALAASGQWLGALVVVWILSFLPFLLPRLRPFWPEQLALVGLLGWQLAGLTSIVLGLLSIALCGRVFLLARGVRGLIRKRPNPGSTMTPGGNVLA
jgi:hypothetical protein